MGYEVHILISGCSGGGKSTLLEALAARGYATVPEPGRRIVAEELAGDGSALPWIDLAAFARRAIDRARADLAGQGAATSPVFFDRGLIDAATALAFAGGPSTRETLAGDRPYARQVFLAPPWPGIFHADAERRHDFEAAEAEYHRLVAAFADLGYEPVVLPKAPVSERVAFVLSAIGDDASERRP